MFELKESDLPELERLAAYGWQWLSRDKDKWIAGSINEPQWSRWGYDHNGVYEWVGKSDMIPPDSKVNIAAAIAQIKAQKKPGCPYCSTDAFERVGIHGKDGFNPYHTYGASRIGGIPKEEHFVYCPMCARKLTETESPAEEEK